MGGKSTSSLARQTRYAALLLALLYSSGLVAGREIGDGPGFVFERISLEQGLSQITVRAILQDRRGFMWFGTEDGLNRYDGYRFTHFKNDPRRPLSLSGDTNHFIHKIKKWAFTHF